MTIDDSKGEQMAEDKGDKYVGEYVCGDGEESEPKLSDYVDLVEIAKWQGSLALELTKLIVGVTGFRDGSTPTRAIHEIFVQSDELVKKTFLQNVTEIIENTEELKNEIM